MSQSRWVELDRDYKCIKPYSEDIEKYFKAVQENVVFIQEELNKIKRLSREACECNAELIAANKRVTKLEAVIVSWREFLDLLSVTIRWGPIDYKKRCGLEKEVKRLLKIDKDRRESEPGSAYFLAEV